VIGDRVVLVPARASAGRDHARQGGRLPSVRVGVRVQVTAQVLGPKRVRGPAPAPPFSVVGTWAGEHRVDVVGGGTGRKRAQGAGGGRRRSPPRRLPRRMRSSLLGAETRPRRAACRFLTASPSSSTLVTPSSPAIWEARAWGRRLGLSRAAGHPAGTLARRSSTTLIVPGSAGTRRSSPRSTTRLRESWSGRRPGSRRCRPGTPRPTWRPSRSFRTRKRVTAGEPEQLRVLPQQRGDFPR